MNNRPLNVGVIYPPDSHYKPILYSDRLATLSFNTLNHDIYSSVQKSKKINKRRTPLSIYVMTAIATLAIAFTAVKKYIK